MKKSGQKRLNFVFLIIFIIGAYIIGINTSKTFAITCRDIPALSKVTSTFCFSPSIKIAIENNYVQKMGLKQTKENITMVVDYVVVDERQVNIYGYFESNTYDEFFDEPELYTANGDSLEDVCFSSNGNWGGKKIHIQVDFSKPVVPNAMQLKCKVRGSNANIQETNIREDNVIAEAHRPNDDYFTTEFNFLLEFNPDLKAKGEIITVDQWFEAEDQRFKVSTIEIYPTFMEIKLEEDPSNSAWLNSIGFYTEDEKGNRIGKKENGITATGAENSHSMLTYRLESPYFSKEKSFDLYYESIVLLDKNREKTKVDLVNKEIEWLPQNVGFKECKKMQNGWQLIFTGKQNKKGDAYQIFRSSYYDEKGTEFTRNGTGMRRREDESFENILWLRDYYHEVVYLAPAYSRRIEYGEPIEVINFTRD